MSGRPRLVLYANRHTKMPVRLAASDLALRLHELTYVTVVRVDLRGVPGFLESFACTSMREAHLESTQSSQARRSELGLPIPADLDERLVFVADSDGTSHQLLGLERGFEEALAVVEDARGRVIAKGEFPRELPAIESALRSMARP